jgi:3alpha(or 20beta)-hydroxysteroid dehydrogenase
MGLRIAITGAASGIGQAIVRRVASEGAEVVAIDRDTDALRDLSVGQRGVIVADVTDESSITEALGSASHLLGGLDVVHANAGVGMDPTPIESLSLDEWQRVLAADLTGVFLTLRAAVPHLRASGGGLLLATGSSTAVRPGQGMLPYVAAKAGVHAMMRSLALEFASEGIRTAVLAPGLTATNMTASREHYIERGLNAVPTGALVDIEDIAAAAAYLMSREAHSVTGSVLVVDAGRTAV